MKTTRYPGTALATYDPEILAYIESHPDNVHDKTVTVGIKNMQWDNYRLIEVNGSAAANELLEFLTTLGLSDLVESGDTELPESHAFYSKLDHLYAPE